MKPLMRTFPPCRHTRALWALLSLAACHAPQGGSADDAPEASRVGATTDTGGGCHTVPYFEDLDGDFKGDPAKPVDPCEPGFSNEKIAPNDNDCNDAEPLAWTDNPEVPCDFVDNDCDGFEAGCEGTNIELVAATIVGPSESAFGVRMIWSPDTDGDGVDDVLASLEYGDWPGSVGEVHRISGVEIKPGTTGGLQDPVMVGAGPDRLGRLLERAGDLDGDGLSDLWVNAGEGAGILYGGTQDVTTPELRLALSYPHGRDVNGDGFSDVIGGDNAAGYLLLGPEAAWATAPSEADASATILWRLCEGMTSLQFFSGRSGWGWC